MYPKLLSVIYSLLLFPVEWTLVQPSIQFWICLKSIMNKLWNPFLFFLQLTAYVYAHVPPNTFAWLIEKTSV